MEFTDPLVGVVVWCYILSLIAADAKIDDAEKNAGESEVREAKLAKANIYALIGDKKQALEWYDQTMEKTVGSGGRIDLVFSVLRMAFCLNDMPLIRKNIAKAKGYDNHQKSDLCVCVPYVWSDLML